MNYIPFTISEKGVTFIYNGKNHTISAANHSYKDVIDALKEKKWDKLPDLINFSKKLKEKSEGNFEVKDGQVYINGKVIPDVISKKIISFMEQQLPFEPIIKFWVNLSKNPSFRARNALFGFLEHNGHPITEEGNFIAYKKVSKSYKDLFTGLMDNSKNKYVSMPREEVDDNPNNTCSVGLHVANLDYSMNVYGSSCDQLIYVEVNPQNVVSVPTDYDGKKMRVCAYTVLGDFEGELDGENLYSRNQDRNSGVNKVYSDETARYDDGYDAGYELAKNHVENGCVLEETKGMSNLLSLLYKDKTEDFKEAFVDGYYMGVADYEKDEEEEDESSDTEFDVEFEDVDGREARDAKTDYDNGYEFGYGDQRAHTAKYESLQFGTGGCPHDISSEFSRGYEDGWNKGKEERRGKH